MSTTPGSARRRALHRDDEGAANLIGFSVALVVFLGAMAFVLLSARTMVPNPSRFSGDPDGHLRATSVVEAMLTAGSASSGMGMPGWDASGSSWTEAPVATDARPGWGRQPDPNMLLNMAQAQRTATVDDKLDYEELRQALGFDASVVGSPYKLDESDLHIRVQPRLPSLAVQASPGLDLVVWYLPSPTAALATQEKAALDALLAAGSADDPTDLVPPGEPALCPLTDTAPDVVVVGSGATLAADPWAFTQAELEAWIKDCGGTLVVLGGDGCGCLPATLSTTDPVGAPAHAVDPVDPALQSPNSLGITRYTPQGTTFAPPASTGYTAMARADDGTVLLWKSRDAAFGLGKVFLVQTTPTQPYGGAGVVAAEAQRLLHNLLTQHYTPLYLDYGPSVPDRLLARPALASATLDFTSYGGSYPADEVIIDVAVWVWPRV